MFGRRRFPGFRLRLRISSLRFGSHLLHLGESGLTRDKAQ